MSERDSEQLTRDELNGIISAVEKNATQLAIIAGRLGELAVTQGKMLDQLQNGVPKELHAKLDALSKDTTFIQWVLNTIGVIVGLIGLKAAYGILTGKP